MRMAFGIDLEPVAFDALLFNAVDLINALIKEQAEGNAGKIIRQLSALDCVIIDELGYIPFPKSGGALVHRANGAPRCLLILLTPSDQQALREDQCHHHYEPGVRRMGLGLR